MGSGLQSDPGIAPPTGVPTLHHNIVTNVRHHLISTHQTIELEELDSQKSKA